MLRPITRCGLSFATHETYLVEPELRAVVYAAFILVLKYISVKQGVNSTSEAHETSNGEENYPKSRQWITTRSLFPHLVRGGQSHVPTNVENRPGDLRFRGDNGLAWSRCPHAVRGPRVTIRCRHLGPRNASSEWLGIRPLRARNGL